MCCLCLVYFCFVKPYVKSPRCFFNVGSWSPNSSWYSKSESSQLGNERPLAVYLHGMVGYVPILVTAPSLDMNPIIVGSWWCSSLRSSRHGLLFPSHVFWCNIKNLISSNGKKGLTHNCCRACWFWAILPSGVKPSKIQNSSFWRVQKTTYIQYVLTIQLVHDFWDPEFPHAFCFWQFSAPQPDSQLA